jgi:hypothetical protein
LRSPHDVDFVAEGVEVEESRWTCGEMSETIGYHFVRSLGRGVVQSIVEVEVEGAGVEE